MTHPTRKLGAKRRLTDAEERMLYREFKALGRDERVSDLALHWNVSRSSLYNILRRVREQVEQPSA